MALGLGVVKRHPGVDAPLRVGVGHQHQGAARMAGAEAVHGVGGRGGLVLVNPYDDERDRRGPGGGLGLAPAQAHQGPRHLGDGDAVALPDGEGVIGDS